MSTIQLLFQRFFQFQSQIPTSLLQLSFFQFHRYYIINSWSIRSHLPLQIDQITPTLTATISIYATNNTRIPPLRQPYPPNHLIIPHSTVLSVSRREQSQPVETNTALSRRQCPIRGTSRSFSPPPSFPSPPLPQPELENATTSSISRGRRREHRCSIGLLLPPLSLSFPSCTRYIHMQIYSASVRAPAYYAYTRGSAGPSRACCRCSGEGHKLNDVNALSTLCRRGETTHELSLSLLLFTPTASHVSPSHSHRYIGPRVTSTIHANP